MPNIQKRPVHCSDCVSETDFLQSLGLTVLGCAHSGGPGQCVISFFDPRLEIAAGAAVAGPATAVTAALAPEAAPDTSPLASAAVGEPPEAAALAGAGAHTPTQARTCKAILNLFETSSVVGRYGSVTVLAGDTGQLTFGRSQTTLGSGNLALLVAQYAANPAARFGARLSPFLPRLQARNVALNTHELLKNILRATADDPVMRDVQDSFFDETYWKPALRACSSIGVTLPLGVAIVYDGHIHGSWRLIRDRVNKDIGSPAQATEKAWLRRYVETRRQWLATNSNALLRKTVNRMDSFGRLIELNNWGLVLPLVVQGQEVSLQSMAATPPDAFDGPQPGTRALLLQTPMLQGLDVRLVQLGLSERGVDVRADAIFGSGSRDAIAAFQQRSGLPVIGMLDMASVLQVAAR